MADDPTCNCPIVIVALAFLIAAAAIATGAILGWLAGALTYAGLWLAAFGAMIFRVCHG